jgi:hypothetical protein
MGAVNRLITEFLGTVVSNPSCYVVSPPYISGIEAALLAANLEAFLL